jgi:hypothetical protein
MNTKERLKHVLLMFTGLFKAFMLWLSAPLRLIVRIVREALS